MGLFFTIAKLNLEWIINKKKVKELLSQMEKVVVVVVEKEQKNSSVDMGTITMWAELSSKATNAQQNIVPDTHVQNAILSTDIAKIQKDAQKAIEQDSPSRKFD